MKRKAKSNAVIDYDDLCLLEILNQSQKKKIIPSIETIRKLMNNSYNSLMIHVKRLNSYNYLKVVKLLESKQRFKGNNILGFVITKEGIKILNLLKSNNTIFNGLNVYSSQLNR
jgi:hypothetical protein